jgi:hypothetical protein
MLALEASQDTGPVFDEVARIGEIAGVFEWLEIIYDEPQTQHIATGGKFIIPVTSNSRIMASLVQSPGGCHLQMPQ